MGVEETSQANFIKFIKIATIMLQTIRHDKSLQEELFERYSQPKWFSAREANPFLAATSPQPRDLRRKTKIICTLGNCTATPVTCSCDTAWIRRQSRS